MDPDINDGKLVCMEKDWFDPLKYVSSELITCTVKNLDRNFFMNMIYQREVMQRMTTIILCKI